MKTGHEHALGPKGAQEHALGMSGCEWRHSITSKASEAQEGGPP
jgi:hypothetical protein